MSSFRFIHTADLHLDSPFKGLSHVPNHLQEHIRNSTFYAYDQIVLYAIEHQIDFLLISGDVYDLQDYSLKAQLYFLKGLERLKAHGIQVYIIHGNHDSIDQMKSSLQWPENVHVFSGDRVEVQAFIKDNQEAVKIYGRSYPTKSFKEKIVPEYTSEVLSEAFQIGLLHTNVDGNPEHDSYAPSSLKELIDSEMDYWALGHIHKGAILSERHPTIIYSGNPQGKHIKETGMKGCVLVEVENKEIESITWLSTSQIVWEKLEISLTETKNLPDVIEIIQQQLDQRLNQINTPIIARIFLTGFTPVHYELRKEAYIEDMRDMLNDHYSNHEGWIWIEGLYLYTRPFNSIEEIMERNDFLSDYIKQLQLYKEKEENQGSFIKDIAMEIIQHRDVRKYANDFSKEELEEIFNQAASLAIDFLLEEEEG